MGLLSVDGRNVDIQEIAQKFEIAHLTHPDMRQIGMSFARLAQEMILRIRQPNDQQYLVDALDVLLDAREAAMVAIAPAARKEQARQANAARKAEDPEPEPEQEEDAGETDEAEKKAKPAPKPAPPRAAARTTNRKPASTSR